MSFVSLDITMSSFFRLFERESSIYYGQTYRTTTVRPTLNSSKLTNVMVTRIPTTIGTLYVTGPDGRLLNWRSQSKRTDLDTPVVIMK